MNKKNTGSIETTKISLFKGKQIRKILYQEEWWFSVIDVVEALTDSSQPSKYWTAMKSRVSDEDGFQLSTICRQLKFLAPDGKMREDDFELIFNMLGERATTEIHRTEDSKGVVKLRSDAKAGGDIAGGARKKLEERLGRSVVTKKNYLKDPESKKRLKNII